MGWEHTTLFQFGGHSGQQGLKLSTRKEGELLQTHRRDIPQLKPKKRNEGFMAQKTNGLGIDTWGDLNLSHAHDKIVIEKDKWR